jgi:hypothetical protein
MQLNLDISNLVEMELVILYPNTKLGISDAIVGASGITYKESDLDRLSSYFREL